MHHLLCGFIAYHCICFMPTIFIKIYLLNLYIKKLSVSFPNTFLACPCPWPWTNKPFIAWEICLHTGQVYVQYLYINKHIFMCTLGCRTLCNPDQLFWENKLFLTASIEFLFWDLNPFWDYVVQKNVEIFLRWRAICILL